RHARQRAAGEQVDEREEPGAPLRVQRVGQDVDVDDRDRDVRTQPVHGDDGQGEDDLVPEVRNLERVDEGAEHGSLSYPWAPRTSALPPAPSIFALAASLNACARTVSALSISPRARILTGRPLRTGRARA